MPPHFSSLLVALPALICGCSGSPPDAGPSIPADISAPIPGTIDYFGRTFVPVTDDYLTHPPTRRKIVKDMSVDEIAWAMSPILNYNNKRYRLAQLDYDLARTIKTGTLADGVVRNIVPGSPSRPTLGLTYFFDPNHRGTPEVFATFETGDGFDYPYSTIVFMSNGCTGTYVGPNTDTMITAAHCMRHNGTNAPYPLTLTPYAFGHDGTVEFAPCGQWDGGYAYFYPTAWESMNCPSGDEEGCAQFDYSVFDFRPSGNPTLDCSGTMGLDINMTGSFGVRRDGYPTWWTFNPGNSTPHDAPPDPSRFNAPCDALRQHANNPTSNYPYLCGEAGDAYEADGWRLESDVVGASPGDSGGPWWGVSGRFNVVAVESGQRSFFDTGCGLDLCYRNYGHLIDTTVWNFMKAYANP